MFSLSKNDLIKSEWEWEIDDDSIVHGQSTEFAEHLEVALFLLINQRQAAEPRQVRLLVLREHSIAEDF